jgi:tRNA (uracil-5-)-methyltransferase TRM9
MATPMNSNTRKALIDINRTFYAGVADAFSDTRSDPWPGWERVLANVSDKHQPTPSTPISVLDVGCGNGRFAGFLEKHLAFPFQYVGIDSSEALLAHAHDKHAAAAHVAFEMCEVLEPQSLPPIARSSFDLICVFGVLHHVPGFATRREFLGRLSAQLKPGGLLAVTAWQFGASERFRTKTLSWDHYNAGASQPIEKSELDPGDHLLGFADKGLPRYCHFAPAEELRELLTFHDQEERLEIVDEYFADGKSGDLNRYALVRRKAASE